jgi:hypothetical protein
MTYGDILLIIIIIFILYYSIKGSQCNNTERFNDSFPGRKFIMKSSWSFGKFLKEISITKANIICSNFPITPENLKKKLKINDGGDEYLLFCTNKNNELIVLSCLLYKG